MSFETSVRPFDRAGQRLYEGVAKTPLPGGGVRYHACGHDHRHHDTALRCAKRLARADRAETVGR